MRVLLHNIMNVFSWLSTDRSRLESLLFSLNLKQSIDDVFAIILLTKEYFTFYKDVPFLIDLLLCDFTDLVVTY